MQKLQEVSQVSQLWHRVAHEAFTEWRCRPGLYLVGGCCDGAHPASAKAVRTVRKYDVVGGTWVPCTALRKARDHLGLVGWRGRLHAIGGWSGSRNRASCETYEPREDAWHTARHRLQTPRSGLAAAVSPSGTCFALAGWGGAQQGFLASAECLQAELPPPRSPGTPHTQRSFSSASDRADSADGARAKSAARPPSRNSAAADDDEANLASAHRGSTSKDMGIASLSHMPVPPSAALHMARHCPAAAALGRFLYLTGGSGTAPDAEAGAGAQPTSSVERLDMERVDKGWDINVAPMILPRYRHALAAVNGCVYACGGQKIDGHATASVERYEPRTNEWVEVAPMNCLRFSHAVAELDGYLYAVGGFSRGKWLKNVERYDPVADKWEELAELDSPISAPGLAVC